MNQESYINDRVDDQIKWYNRKSILNQRWFKALRLIEIVCSTLIPFIAGYVYIFQAQMIFFIGALGVIVAVVAGSISLFQFHENWLEYRSTCETLKTEKHLFLTCAQPYDCGDESFNLFVQRIEAIISGEYKNWRDYRGQACGK